MKLHRRHVTIIGVAMVVMLGTASPWNGQGAQARQRPKTPAGAPGDDNQGVPEKRRPGGGHVPL